MDGDDTVPTDDAVDWKRSPGASYAWIPLAGYDPATHGNPVSMNNRGDVLCGRAVWSGGTWTPLNQQGEEYAVTDGSGSAPAVLDPGWAVDIDDAGRVLGGGELPDTLRNGDAGYHSILWTTPQARPFIVGRNPGSAIFPSETTGLPLALAPDGRILTSDTAGGSWPENEVWAWRAPGEAQTAAGLAWAPPPGSTASLPQVGFGGPLWTWCRIPAGGACVARLHDAANNEDSAVLLEPGGTGGGLPTETFVPPDPKARTFVAGAAPPAADPAKQAAVVLAVAEGGDVFVGRKDAAGIRGWKPAPSLQGAKAVNARGEATDGTSLWRNGEWVPVRGLIPPGDLPADQQVGVVDLNDDGLILCGARQAGSTPEAGCTALRLGVPVEARVFLTTKTENVTIGVRDGNYVCGTRRDKINDANDPTGFKTQTASELNVATLQDAFEQDGGGWAFKAEKIATDRDAFRILVGPVKVTVGNTLTAKLWTTGDLADPGAEITLDPVPDKPDFYQSKGLCLVADEEDDTLLPGVAADGTLDDQTFAVALGGKVNVEVLGLKSAPTGIPDISLPVPVKKTVKVKAWVLKKGQFNQTHVTTQAAAEARLLHASQRVAQCGIKLDYTVVMVAANPEGVMFGQTFGDSDFKGPAWNDETGLATLQPETKALLSAPWLQPVAGEVGLYFVSNLSTGVGATTVASATNPADSAFANRVIVDAESMDRWTLAHELVHLLADGVHGGPSPLWWQEFNNWPWCLWFIDQMGGDQGALKRKRLIDTMKYRMLASPFCK